MKITSIQWQDALPIRHQVLWPDKAIEFCQVPGDENALHYGVYIDEKLVCTASVYIEQSKARLRKFATLAEFQGQGLGSKLLSHIINNLKINDHIDYFWCDARETATDFYHRFGFQIESDLFYKSNIAYYKMGMTLPAAQ